MKPNVSPWTIRQKCTADWERMQGNDKRRFCEHCQRFVYNVSAMNHAEREAFASPANMQACVFYSQRSDGGIADLSLLARLRRWIPIFRLACWSVLVAILPATLTGCMGARCPRPGEVRPIPRDREPDSWQPTNQIRTVESPEFNYDHQT